MTVLEAMYNSLPKKATKDVMFSVRMDDNLHKRVLMFAKRTSENRAPALVQLAELGLLAWAEQEDISLSESDIDSFLKSEGLIVDESNNSKT